MTLDEACALHLDTSAPDRPVVVAYRFLGYAKSGARIDLCCAVCGHRVALNAHSIELLKQPDWLVFCRECVAAIEGRCHKPLVDKTRSGGLSEEDLADLTAAAATWQASESECRDRLRLVTERAKAHWDALGEPYPPHLQSLIDYLSKG